MGATKTMDFLIQAMGETQTEIIRYKYGKCEHKDMEEAVANLLLASYHATLLLGKEGIDENIINKMSMLDIKYGGDGSFTSTSTQEYYGG